MTRYSYYLPQRLVHFSWSPVDLSPPQPPCRWQRSPSAATVPAPPSWTAPDLPDGGGGYDLMKTGYVPKQFKDYSKLRITRTVITRIIA